MHENAARQIGSVEQAAGQPGHVGYDAVASVVYTAPEIASVDSGAMLDERDPHALATRIWAAHAAIVELMMEPGVAKRPGTHPEWGRVPAEHFAAYHARHADEHFRELARAFPPR